MGRGPDSVGDAGNGAGLGVQALPTHPACRDDEWFVAVTQAGRLVGGLLGGVAVVVGGGASGCGVSDEARSSKGRRASSRGVSGVRNFARPAASCGGILDREQKQ